MHLAPNGPAWAPLAALILAAAALAATASAAAADPNETCLACHSDKDAKGSSGKSIAVDPASFAKSVHGESKLACTACHTDVSEKKIPHPEKLKPVDCGTCHEKPVASCGSRPHCGPRVAHALGDSPNVMRAQAGTAATRRARSTVAPSHPR